LLAILLLRVDRYRTDQPHDERRALPEFRVYQEFLIQVENGFRTEHRVAAYADALNLSPARLSRALSRAVGKTAKQLIAERIVLEAKRQLTYTTLSVKEIAQSLGFHDQFRFSKVFKSQTGLPPQAFREQWLKAT
jgi:AraC-like DNA-binding protein